ncbi:MAG: NADH-quinone oxidoreductase subunit C [Desulfobulbus sp.]|nr:NADH-quinone oxidoreductase subunit C [Desulfobulbus sp.]
MSVQNEVWLGNGKQVALEQIPSLAYDIFADRVLTEYASGSRVAAYFGVPPENPADDVSLEIFAVMARERHSNFAVYRTAIGEHFQSLTPNCPQLHLFEREIAEQYGVTPEGHPWLKPIRFHASWRPGHDVWGRDTNIHPLPGAMDFYRVNGDGIHEVAVGPVHAGIIEPGHFRFQCYGEKVLHLEISLGYQHRGLEKALIGGPYPSTAMQMETIAGDTTIGHMTAYSKVIEGLAGGEAQGRAQAIRAVGLELERLANHVGDIGALSGDIGFLPTASFCGRLRGDYLNMTAALCGSRFGRGLVRPGGVGFDLDQELIAQLLVKLTAVEAHTLGACHLFFDTPSVLGRLERVGRVTRSTAEDLGLVGIAAKASGVPRDSRFFFPTGIYRETFDEMITDELGDVFARARMRYREIEVSIKIVRRLLNNLPKGSVMIAPGSLRPKAFCLAMVEGWRGEVVHVALTGEDGRFRRYKIVDPSFHNWSGLAMAMRGTQISNFPVCNKSFGLSYCGFDV